MFETVKPAADYEHVSVAPMQSALSGDLSIHRMGRMVYAKIRVLNTSGNFGNGQVILYTLPERLRPVETMSAIVQCQDEGSSIGSCQISISASNGLVSSTGGANWNSGSHNFRWIIGCVCYMTA